VCWRSGSLGVRGACRSQPLGPTVSAAICPSRWCRWKAAAKATRFDDVVITDGQASSDEEELRHLAVGSDLVLLPTAPKARAVELALS